MTDCIDDIKLSEKDTAALAAYHRYGDGVLRSYTRQAKAKNYIAHNLDLLGSESQPHSGRYCSAGTLTYARKDGGDITDNDITALLCINRGQVNRVQSRETKQVTIYWLCDSSD